MVTSTEDEKDTIPNMQKVETSKVVLSFLSTPTSPVRNTTISTRNMKLAKAKKKKIYTSNINRW